MTKDTPDLNKDQKIAQSSTNLSTRDINVVQPSTSLSTSDKLALTRTSLSYDRTLLAWVRTSIGIIGFGLTFYKFFEYLGEHEKYIPRHRILGPREYAIVLIICGEVTLLASTFDYYRAKKSIMRIDPDLPPSRVPLIAIFVVAFGFFSMVATLLRL